MHKCLATLILLLAGASWLPADGAEQKEATILGKRVSEWVTVLEGNDANARRDALLTLSRAGPEAKPLAGAVVKTLKDSDVLVRRYAVMVLGKLGPEAKEALPALLAALKDADLGVRGQAGYTLAPFGGAAVPGLIEVMQDAKHPGRQYAMAALLALGPKSEKAVDVLIEALAEPTLHYMAAATLEKIGPPAVPALLKAADKHAERCFPLLGRLRAKEAVSVLTKGLDDGSENVRQVAAQALSALGLDAAPATKPLIKALKDKNENMRYSAIEALGKIGPAAKEAVGPLCEHIKPGEVGAPKFLIQPPLVLSGPKRFPANSGTRLAVEALIGIGLDAPAATPTLLAMLKGKNASDRALAVSALSVVGKNAIGDLLPLMKDNEPALRVQVAEILGGIGGESKEVVAALGAALSDADAIVSLRAAQSLGRLGGAATSAVPELAKAFVNSKNASTRLAMIDVLGRIGAGSKVGVMVLAEALHDEDADVSQNAAAALGRLGPEAAPAVQDLRKVLTSAQDGDVRAQAAQALGDIGPAAAAAIPDLIKALKNSDDPVRQWSAYALGGIGPKAKEAVEVLTEMQRDGDPFVRRAATRALAKIRGDKK